MTEPERMVVEEDRVILRGELATDVISDVAWSETPGIDEFKESFEVLGDDFPGDPKESWYQGVTFTSVIRRKSDNRLFGFSWWTPVSKHGEPFIESNYEEHGIEVEYTKDWEPIGGEPFVFLPVEPFTVTGYAVALPSTAGA